jgi:Flp pilus assembly pilin Flp
MYDLIKTSLSALRGDRRGVTAVEYAVIAGVMVVAVAAAFNAFGTTLKSYLTGLSL